MELPKISGENVRNKKVILRLDLDTSEGDNYRLNSSLDTLSFLSSNKAKTIIIGHKGRPEGKTDASLSLEPTSKELSQLLGKPIKFVKDMESAIKEIESMNEGDFIMLENLRFNAGEESNDEVFAKSLAELAEVYINDAFASSHREHASIVGIPKFLPHFIGMHFDKELENLNRVIEEPKRPLLFLISGVKKDKLEMVKALSGLADKVLVGGRLPEYLGDEQLVSVRSRGEDEKVLIGNLIMDKEDITLNTIERFEMEIKKAGTIVLAGVLGKYEDEGHRQGTERVFKAVANSQAFKVVGGGDSLAALSMYNLSDKFDWISVGGGAMLEYLTNKTLPGLQALLE